MSVSINKISMAKKINYLSKTFSDLAKQLSAKELAKGMRGGLRAEANRVKRKAQTDMLQAAQSAGLHVDNTFRQSVRQQTPKNLSGFVVTVLFNKKRRKGYYQTRRGPMPIALWAESGTVRRQTKGGKRRGHDTGRMKSLGGVLAKTGVRELKRTELNVSKNIGRSVMRIAKKKGLSNS